MSDFVRFQSLQQDWMVAAFSHADFQESLLAVTEKIDGANIQLWFDRDKPCRIGKRSGFIERGESFFNLQEVSEARREDIGRLAQHAASRRLQLRLFGELFGREVLRRIDYGTPGDLRLFAMEVGGERLPFREFATFLEELELSRLCVPVLGVETIDRALQRNAVFPSQFNPSCEAEGFVVCGYDKLFAGRTKIPFVCKVKNPAFADIEGSEEPTENPRYLPLLRYINRNRIASVVSKHGEFDDRRQIGRYIQLVIDEIDADFQRDHGVPSQRPAADFRTQIAALVADHMKRNGRYRQGATAASSD